MTFAAGRGTVFACRALPQLQQPDYMRLSPLYFLFTFYVPFVGPIYNRLNSGSFPTMKSRRRRPH